jgi:hypothetical protein
MILQWERGYVKAVKDGVKTTRLADSRLQHDTLNALIHTRGPHVFWYLTLVHKEYPDGLFPLYTQDIVEAEERASRIIVAVMPGEFKNELAAAQTLCSNQPVTSTIVTLQPPSV